MILLQMISPRHTDPSWKAERKAGNRFTVSRRAMVMGVAKYLAGNDSASFAREERKIRYTHAGMSKDIHVQFLSKQLRAF